jgi:hypothetical protein
MEGGGCNGSGLGIDDARANTPCTNTGGLPVFAGTGGTNTDAFITAYGVGFGAPNRARLLWSVNRASSNPATLAGAPSKQFAAELNWFDDNAVEAGGGCTGCSAQVGQTLNFVVLESAFQNASGDAVAASISSSDAGSAGSTCIGGDGCGSVVPVKNKTWGLLKSLYR